jgi:hypothetical protein
MKIAAMRDWPVPLSTTELRLFLGLAVYYRKFVHYFAHRTTETSTLRTEERAFWWLQKHPAELDDILRALVSAPVLALCNPERDYILRIDASDVAIGGVLAQKQSWGTKRRLAERPRSSFLENYTTSRGVRSVSLRVIGDPQQLDPLGALPWQSTHISIYGSRVATAYPKPENAFQPPMVTPG